MAFNFWNVPAKIKPLPVVPEAQQQGINQLFQQGLQNYNPDNVEKYARQQFQGQTVPSISERFTAGGLAPTDSSFRGALGAAGSQLEGQLAGQRYEHGLNQIKLGLTPQFEYLYEPEQQGFAESAATNVANSLANKAPDLALKAGEYVWNKVTGRKEPQQQNQQPSVAQDLANAAASGAGTVAGEKGVNALQSALTPAAQGEQAAKTAVENQTAQQMAQQAVTGTGATAATGAAVGAGTKGTSAAVTALKGLAPAAKAAIFSAVALGVPAAIAALGFSGIALYEWYQDMMEEKYGTSLPPLPSNWNDLSISDRYQQQLARQIKTPQGTREMTRQELAESQQRLKEAGNLKKLIAEGKI